MTDGPRMTLDDFLAARVEDVRAVAPETMIYSVSGTRRAAVLAGEVDQGENYVRWSRRQMIHCLRLIFEHGVRHIFMPVITPSQFGEATPGYREHLWHWLEWGLAGQEALADYRSLNWRVHLPFSDMLPRLSHAGDRLKATASNSGQHSLWIFVVPEHNLLTTWALAHLQAWPEPISSAEEAARVIYGESIAPARLYLDFGKPIVSPDLLPPFLVGVLHCYWSQVPGYSLTQEQLRRILYDYAFVRRTWHEDKTGRAEQALAHRSAWESDLVLGLGRRLGPFWYPSAPEACEGTECPDA